MKKRISRVMFVLCTLFMCIVGFANQAAAETHSTGTPTSSGVTNENQFLNYKCVKTIPNRNPIVKKFSYYLRTSSSYYGIPGLVNTNVAGKNCDYMTPQGICHMDDYTIISAYCANEKHNHKPVLYALKNNKLIATLVLPYDRNMHAGGVTYDGTYLWIANGATNYDTNCNPDASEKRIYYLQKSVVIAAINACVERKAYSFSIPSTEARYVSLSIDPAFCSYYDGHLWCGKFNSYEPDEMGQYIVDKSVIIRPKLTLVGSMQVPRATQGVTFYKNSSGKLHFITSNSWCRTEYGVDGNRNKYFEHSLIVYAPTDYSSQMKKSTNRNFHKGSRICDITIPNMSEGISPKGFGMFIIFESAAQKYYEYVDKSIRSDKYCELSLAKVCEVK